MRKNLPFKEILIFDFNALKRRLLLLGIGLFLGLNFTYATVINTPFSEDKVDGGTLSEDPFYFCVGDGEADHVSKVSAEGAEGPNSQWVVTDEDGKILGLPPSPDAVNFDGAPPGVCLIWHLSYADGLEGLKEGNNALTDLKGCYDLSNEVRVVRNAVIVDGGTLSEDPFYFCVGDGEADHVSKVSAEGAEGPNSQWVVTVEDGKILGLPPSPDAVNFDGAGAGVCLIWHLSYADGLQGLEAGNNLTDLMGTYDLSDDNVRVYRSQPDGGELSGGPYEFVVGDGIADHAKGVSVSGNQGANSQWVVTDESGKILGLPPSPDAVNFDGAPPGVCLIWHLSYADGLEGLKEGNNALTDLKGCYDLSNEIRVERVQPAQIGNENITLYPLPALNVIHIAAEKLGVASFSLFDLAGNDMTNRILPMNASATTFDIQSLSSGLYYLRIRDDRGRHFTKKILKQ